jgi:hypothetical protein
MRPGCCGCSIADRLVAIVADAASIAIIGSIISFDRNL